MAVGNKIIVLGCSGSGKSVFSRKLHKKTGLPLIHLDNIWWKADRTHISRDEFDDKLRTILSEPKWIIDGNYSRTYEMRIQACDTIILLDFSEETCMKGIIDRVGTKREDIPWTEKTLDPELVQLVQNYRTADRPVLLSLMEKYPAKQKIIFQTRSEADQWVSGI